MTFVRKDNGQPALLYAHLFEGVLSVYDDMHATHLIPMIDEPHEGTVHGERTL